LATQSLKIRNQDNNPIVSIRTGNWNDPDTWSCNRVPPVSDVVTLTAGHTVTLPGSITGFAQRLQQYGWWQTAAGAVAVLAVRLIPDQPEVV